MYISPSRMFFVSYTMIIGCISNKLSPIFKFFFCPKIYNFPDKTQGGTPMLSLRLKTGEYLTIGDDIKVQVFKQTGDSVELAIQAPRDLTVLRGKLTNPKPDIHRSAAG